MDQRILFIRIPRLSGRSLTFCYSVKLWKSIVIGKFVYFTETMAYISSPEESQSFWQRRQIYLVFTYPELAEKCANLRASVENRREKEERDKNKYLLEHTFLPIPQNVAGVNESVKTSADLRFWAKYNSWTFCSTCNSLLTKIMPYNFAIQQINGCTKKCVCTQSRYIVPLYKDIPNCLLALTNDDIDVLRPYYLFLEDYERPAHGYRVKCCAIKLRISQQSVEEKIHDLTDSVQKERCENA